MDIIAKIKKTKPLIHHITNFVTANDCANITLAIGGRPVMAVYEGETEEIVSEASALIINIGTLMPYALDAMIKAGHAARKANIPIIFDPVGCGASSYRSSAAAIILSEVKPDIIKGNQAEINHLLSSCKMSGVDSPEHMQNIAVTASILAKNTNSTVMATGSSDCITDGTRTAFVKNGTPMLSRITGTGCMLNSLTACCAAVCSDMYSSCIKASSVMGICGQTAQSRLAPYEGTGTFRQRLIDAVSLIDDEETEREAIIDYV